MECSSIKKNPYQQSKFHTTFQKIRLNLNERFEHGAERRKQQAVILGMQAHANI